MKKSLLILSLLCVAVFAAAQEPDEATDPTSTTPVVTVTPDGTVVVSPVVDPAAATLAASACDYC